MALGRPGASQHPAAPDSRVLELTIVFIDPHYTHLTHHHVYLFHPRTSLSSFPSPMDALIDRGHAGFWHLGRDHRAASH